jgi:hypothetical protein
MFRQFRKIEPNEFFVISADTAAGGEDYCAAQFLSKTKLDVPLVYHSPILATQMTIELLPVLNKIKDMTGIKPVVAYERQNGGLFEMERLALLNRENKFNVFKMPNFGSIDPTEPTKYGWDTNTATRPKMLSDLKEAVDKSLLKVYDKSTIEEMFSFIISKTSVSWKAQAEQNAHDDLVMSLAIAWQLYQLCDPPKSEGEFRVFTGGDKVTGYGKKSEVRFFKK